MDKHDLGQTLQILTNVGIMLGLLFLYSKVVQDTGTRPAPSESANEFTDVMNEGYSDVAALKCPSSYDDETQSFRNINYWLFQKNPADHDISMISRPDRNTGTWNYDVNNDAGPMIITPDNISWTSYLYTGNYYSLNRKDLTMERQRVNRTTITSQCDLVSGNDARKAVTLRYQNRLKGNKI